MKLRECIVAVILLSVVGCSGPGAPTATKAGTAQALCPVMGEEINKNLFVDYEGKRIYVCCQKCVSTVEKDPAKYVKQLEDQGIILDKAETPAKP